MVTREPPANRADAEAAPPDGERVESVPPLPALSIHPDADLPTLVGPGPAPSVIDPKKVELALAGEAANQAQRGVQTVFLISAVAAVLLQLAYRRPATHTALTIALVALAAVSGLQAYRIRTGGKLMPVSLISVLAALVTLAGIAHVGVVSFVAMLLPVLVYFVANTDLWSRSVAVLTTCCVGYLALALLAYLGVLPQGHAPVIVSHGNPRAYLTTAVVVEVVLGLTFLLARLTRRGTLEAMHLLEDARREIGARDAQLEEVRADLDRALAAAQIGRYTGRRVDHYLVAEVIGRGGMGEVYRAVDERTERSIALKVLHPHLREDPEQVERFLREARICGELDSPNIVRVLSAGTAPDGSPYLAMELLQGQSLAESLRRFGRLRFDDARRVVDDVARALEVAQREGIVHRDLKPQNVFRAASGGSERWVVLDFGVSKFARGEATLTHSAFVGTPSYVAPEQARGRDVDHRADVFSLGVIAYRCITGRLPFRAEDPSSVLLAVMARQPTRPSELAGIEPDVDLVLALALAKDPDRRFQTAAQLARALRDAASGSLEPDLRERARKLVEGHPWGTQRIEPGSERPGPAARAS